MPQKILWAEVRKETGRGKSRWKIQDLFADQRCSQAVLDFLTATDVGRTAPAVEEVADVESEVSEGELRERREREEGREVEAAALGAGDEAGDGEEPPLFLPTPPFMAPAGEE